MQTFTPSSLQSFIRPLREFIFPPVCFSCGAHRFDISSKVCESCWASIRYVKISDDLYLETKGKLESSGTISGLVSLCYFDPDGVVQTLVHELKYNGMTSVGVELGKKVGGLLLPLVEQFHPDGLVPVPLHRTKLRERGYNQSEYVCKGISESTGIPVYTRVLQRVRYTPSQTALDIEQRKLNVSDAFDIGHSLRFDLTGKTMVMVDDVITTGATIVECAKVLRNRGVERVIACSVGLAP